MTGRAHYGYGTVQIRYGTVRYGALASTAPLYHTEHPLLPPLCTFMTEDVSPRSCGFVAGRQMTKSVELCHFSTFSHLAHQMTGKESFLYKYIIYTVRYIVPGGLHEAWATYLHYHT